MEFKIKREDILKGLGVMQGIVDRKTTMPILANVVLDASTRKLSITATDLEVGINHICPAEVGEKGKLAVHAKSFYDIMRELPEDTVHFAAEEGGSLGIECKKGRYKIVAMPPDEFPALPTRGQGETWRMESAALSRMIERTSFAISTDEARFNLSGVYLHPDGEGVAKRLKMVATDGHRLSIMVKEVGAKCAVASGAIIPRKGIQELKKLLDSGAATVDLWMDSKNLIAYVGETTMTMRLVDAQFPAYEQVIPAKSERVVSVSRLDLIRALRRVSVLTADRTRGVKFSVTAKGMEITGSNPDLGEAREEVEASYRGEAFDVGFNAKYFIEALSAIEDEVAVLELGDETAPCVLRSELDRGFTHAIMPMRL